MILDGLLCFSQCPYKIPFLLKLQGASMSSIALPRFQAFLHNAQDKLCTISKPIQKKLENLNETEKKVLSLGLTALATLASVYVLSLKITACIIPSFLAGCVATLAYQRPYPLAQTPPSKTIEPAVIATEPAQPLKTLPECIALTNSVQKYATEAGQELLWEKLLYETPQILNTLPDNNLASPEPLPDPERGSTAE